MIQGRRRGRTRGSESIKPEGGGFKVAVLLNVNEVIYSSGAWTTSSVVLLLLTVQGHVGCEDQYDSWVFDAFSFNLAP